MVDQKFGALAMTATRRQMRWRAIVGMCITDVSASIEKQSSNVFVFMASGNVKRRIGLAARVVPLDVGALIESESHLMLISLLGGMPELLLESSIDFT